MTCPDCSVPCYRMTSAFRRFRHLPPAPYLRTLVRLYPIRVLRGGPANDIDRPHPTAIPGRVEPARDRRPRSVPTPLAPDPHLALRGQFLARSEWCRVRCPRPFHSPILVPSPCRRNCHQIAARPEDRTRPHAPGSPDPDHKPPFSLEGALREAERRFSEEGRRFLFFTATGRKGDCRRRGRSAGSVGEKIEPIAARILGMQRRLKARRRKWRRPLLRIPAHKGVRLWKFRKGEVGRWVWSGKASRRSVDG